MLKMKDVIKHNKAIGHHFFDKDTKRFFRSRIESELIDDKYFITSESYSGMKDDRRYTVREYNKETGEITDASEFYKLETLDAAKDFIEFLRMDVIYNE